MKAPSMPVLIGAGALVVVLGVVWLTRKGNAASAGAAVGGAVVDLAAGVVGGAADGVADIANDPNKNPLQPFGAWLGGMAYDLTH